MAALLRDEGAAAVTVCYPQTFLPGAPSAQVRQVTRSADLLFVSVNQPRLVGADMVKPGAVVIDAGHNYQVVDGKLKVVGDVDIRSVSSVA